MSSRGCTTSPWHLIAGRRGVGAQRRNAALRRAHDTARRAHSPRIALSRTTLFHFGMSSRMSFANSSGLLPTISKPTLARRSFASGSFTMRMTSACSLSMIGRGVRAGARSPYHASAAKPGKPCSATVGTSGNANERFAPVVRIARIAVDKQERRARAAVPQPDHRAARAHIQMLETGEVRCNFGAAPARRVAFVIVGRGGRHRLQASRCIHAHGTGFTPS